MDIKNGWFGSRMRCVYGGDIYRWVLKHIESIDSKARNICQKILDFDLMANIDSSKQNFMTIELYQLNLDRTDIANNLLRKWRSKPRGALGVSANLIPLIDKVYEQAIKVVELDEGEEEEEEVAKEHEIES